MLQVSSMFALSPIIINTAITERLLVYFVASFKKTCNVCYNNFTA